MSKILTYIIEENNNYMQFIEDDFWGVLDAMGLHFDDYYDISIIELGNKKYDLYTRQISYKDDNKITSIYHNKEKFYCGTILLTKHNRKQELISLNDKDIDIIRKNIIDPKEKEKRYNGKVYKFSSKILLL